MFQRFERYNILSPCLSDKKTVKMKISMEGRWNDTNKKEQEHWEENLSRSQFLHHKPLPDPVYPPWTSNEFAPDGNRLISPRSWWLNTWTMICCLNINLSKHLTGIYFLPHRELSSYSLQRTKIILMKIIPVSYEIHKESFNLFLHKMQSEYCRVVNNHC